MLKLPATTTRSGFVALAGGLDLEGSGNLVKPGYLIGGENYEPKIGGGYGRIGGYERYDGRPQPSDAKVRLFAPAGTPFDACAVGDVLTGSVSGATGVVAYATPQLIAVTKRVGTFSPGENLLRGATLIGSTRSTEPSIDPLALNEVLAAAEDVYRADIGAPPGSGPLRGGAVLNNQVFAFRDNVGATACLAYRATSAGWVAVEQLWEVAFTGGGTAYAEGSTLSKGGVTATVRRAVVQTGDWGGSATGRLIITAPVGGNFTAGAAAGGGTCTLSGPATAITLAPGGRWQFREHNFTGDPARRRLYGCDGVNRPIEFDGTVIVPLETGMPATMRPQAVEVHRNHLFLAFEGSIQHSAPSDPYRWTPVRGAGELGAGDRVTGILSLSGQETSAALLALCRNSAHVVYGTSSADWKMVNLSTKAGGKPYTLRQVQVAMALDDQGVRTISPTQAFGNFTFDTATDRLRTLASSLEPVASIVDPVNGRYKLLTADGRGLSGAPGRDGRMAWAPLNLRRSVSCAFEGELDGQAAIFFGDANGMLYRMDRGRGFDGQELTAWCRLAYSSLGSPLLRKSFRVAELEMRGDSAGQLRAQADFSFGDLATQPTPVLRSGFQGPAAYWDVGNWDTATWDGQYATRVRMRIEGNGVNVSLLLNSRSRTELPHEIFGVTVTFIPRRSER